MLKPHVILILLRGPSVQEYIETKKGILKIC